VRSAAAAWSEQVPPVAERVDDDHHLAVLLMARFADDREASPRIER